MIYEVAIDGTNYRVELSRAPEGWRCQLNGSDVPLDVVQVRPAVLSAVIGGKAYEIKCERAAAGMEVWIGSTHYAAEVRDPRSLRGRKVAGLDTDGPRKLIASMPGKVVRVLMQEGSEVEAGQSVLVVEAMKMQNEMKSPKKGRIKNIVALEGAAVNAGDVLVIVE